MSNYYCKVCGADEIAAAEAQCPNSPCPMELQRPATNFERVREFMTAFGQTILPRPIIPCSKTVTLRLELIQEEFEELMDAFYEKDIVAVADALTDILVVTYGAGLACGINLDRTFEEVHRSNMSKLGADGKPIYREDGKVLKGPNYSPPNLEPIIQEH